MRTPEFNESGLELHCCDCMELMAQYPDKHFDLAIVDPPYGIGASEMKMGKGIDQQWKQGKNWDSHPPDDEYFKQLFRVSKRQIIWGGNLFNLPKNNGWIFWDKCREKQVSFSDGELAWTGFLNTIRKASIRYDGFVGADQFRIHPTQKPVALYSWILSKYATPEMTILDTHLGSGSIAIACRRSGNKLIASEIDADYFNDAVGRIKRELDQALLPL